MAKKPGPVPINTEHDTYKADGSFLVTALPWARWYNDLLAYVLSLTSGGSGPVSGLRIVTFGDSHTARQNLFRQAWPQALQEELNAKGVPASVYSVAMDGCTFYRAQLAPSSWGGTTFGSNSAVAQCNAYAPDIILIPLGAADTWAAALTDGRTITQVLADCDSFFAAVRAANPKALMLYLSEVWYDQTNYPTPGTTLHNEGALPYFWNLTTTSPAIVQSYYCAEALTNSVTSTTLGHAGDWMTLDAHIKGKTPAQGVDGYANLDFWKGARMGGLVKDGLHPTAHLSLLEAGSVMKSFQLPIFAATMPNLQENNQADWEEIGTLFSSMFNASGTGWVETYSNDSECVRAVENYMLRPALWYHPYKGNVYPNLSFNAGVEDQALWIAKDIAPLSLVSVSADGGAFASTSTTTNESGFAADIISGRESTLSVGTHHIRYQCGPSVFAPSGGFVVVVGAGTPVPLANGGTAGTSAATAIANLTLTTGTQPGFTGASYAGTWADYTAGGNFGAGYMQETRGKVVLHGAATGGTAGQTIYTLPVGMRPSKTLYFTQAGNGVFATIQVNTNGTVVFNAGTAPVGFDGIEFWPL